MNWAKVLKGNVYAVAVAGILTCMSVNANAEGFNGVQYAWQKYWKNLSQAQYH